MKDYYSCWCWGVSSKDVTVAAQIVHMPEMIIWLEGRYGLRLKYFHDKFRFDPKSRYSQNATDDEDGQTCDVLWSFQTGGKTSEDLCKLTNTEKRQAGQFQGIFFPLFMAVFYHRVYLDSI